MAEMQRKRDKEKKRSDSSDILADILESVTATKEKPTPPKIKPLEPRKFQTNSSVPPVKQETRSKVTIAPISSNLSVKLLPMKPAAPVTRNLLFSKGIIKQHERIINRNY